MDNIPASMAAYVASQGRQSISRRTTRDWTPPGRSGQTRKTRWPGSRARDPSPCLAPWVGPHPAHRRIPVAKAPISDLPYDPAPYRSRPVTEARHRSGDDFDLGILVYRLPLLVCLSVARACLSAANARLSLARACLSAAGCPFRRLCRGHAGVTISRHSLLPWVGGGVANGRLFNAPPEEPVFHRRGKAGSGVSYSIKRLRSVNRGLTHPGLLMSFLPVGEGTFPAIQRPSHRPAATLHHGQHLKSAGPGSDGPGRWQFALPSDFHC